MTVPVHRIQVVDSETGRGIPAVQLKTTDSRIFFTDSAGVVAFCEPELMGTTLWFTLTSFGYVYPPNGFGQHGTTVEIKPGGDTVLKMDRVNVAQRLYRITGTDIYRDSVLLGDEVPPTQDKTDSPVMGMDSVQSAIYRGKMYWFWGDTSQTRNPLGNFRTTGAVSELPGQGGLDPDVGVFLTFWRDGANIRQMFDDRHAPIWVGGPRVVKDDEGKEHLFINYVKVRGAMHGVGETGIAEFDDDERRLKIVLPFPEDLVLKPLGMPLPYEVNGKPYFYFTQSWANIRCPATLAAMTDMSTLETFTCIKEGRKFEGSEDDIDRNADGTLRWAWRKGTSPVDNDLLRQMLEKGLIRADESPIMYLDANTSTTPILNHGGTIYYNPYRKRWTQVFSQLFGAASFLGEIWYAEGDTPLGPWVYSQKIITHRMGEEGIDATTFAKKEAQTYSFYNPKQHPEFMKDNGRIIYLEGTYTAGFTNNQFHTPGYNYNQIMYKMDLDDPRTFVPVPVYRVEGEPAVYRTKTSLPEGQRDIAIAFFAPDRPREGTVPVYEVRAEGKKQIRLTLDKPTGGATSGKATEAFYAVDPATQGMESTPLVGLHEYLDADGNAVYTTDEAFQRAGFTRSEKPLCLVWPNPIHFDPLAWDYAAR